MSQKANQGIHGFLGALFHQLQPANQLALLQTESL
jgi:hypothetical protein